MKRRHVYKSTWWHFIYGHARFYWFKRGLSLHQNESSMLLCSNYSFTRSLLTQFFRKQWLEILIIGWNRDASGDCVYRLYSYLTSWLDQTSRDEAMSLTSSMTDSLSYLYDCLYMKEALRYSNETINEFVNYLHEIKVILYYRALLHLHFPKKRFSTASVTYKSILRIIVHIHVIITRTRNVLF